MTTSALPSSQAAPAGPRPVRWTCAEFHRFGDLGVFEGRRAMLIDGVILEEGPMNPPHAITLELVEEALRTAFGAGWRIRGQSPLVLGQDLDPEPDFAVITPNGCTIAPESSSRMRRSTAPFSPASRAKARDQMTVWSDSSTSLKRTTRIATCWGPG